MYEVVTVYQQGRRIHLVVEDETNRVIDKFFDHQKAEKLRRKLNNQVRKDRNEKSKKFMA